MENTTKKLSLAEHPLLFKAQNYFSLRASPIKDITKNFNNRSKQNSNATFSQARLTSSKKDTTIKRFHSQGSQNRSSSQRCVQFQITNPKVTQRNMGLENQNLKNRPSSKRLFKITTDPCLLKQQIHLSWKQPQQFQTTRNLASKRFQFPKQHSRIKSTRAYALGSKTYINAMKALQEKIKKCEAQNIAYQKQVKNISSENKDLKSQFELIQNVLKNNESISQIYFENSKNIAETIKNLIENLEQEKNQKQFLTNQFSQIQMASKKLIEKNGLIEQQKKNVENQNAELNKQIKEMESTQNKEAGRVQKEIQDLENQNTRNLELSNIELDQLKEENNKLKRKIILQKQQIQDIMVYSTQDIQEKIMQGKEIDIQSNESLSTHNSCEEEQFNQFHHTFQPQCRESKMGNNNYHQKDLQCCKLNHSHSQQPQCTIKHLKCQNCHKIKPNEYEQTLQKVIQKEKNIIFLNRKYSNSLLHKKVLNLFIQFTFLE